MKKIILVVIIVLLSFLGFILFNKPQTQQSSVLAPSPTQEIREINIKASFAIVTGNITRSFNAEKYHNQSPDTYIESVDPSVIYVEKIGITWNDFFKTLPMKLTKDCLITGDGETLCNGKGGTLIFYLNNVETPDLLDKEIKDGDKALIKFSPK